jgi:membrane-associated protein
VDQLLHYIVQLDEYLGQAVEALGPWAYGAIFLTIFGETGLVVTPFLPGESLLLTSGTLAGAGVLNIAVLWPLLAGAAFLGDVVNYLIGRWLGKHLLSKPRKHLRPEHIREAQAFYEEHGGLAIIACRFLPIVRTLVPFVAGVTKMEFHRYLAFAALASAIWVTIFLGAGYLFGNVPWVQEYLAIALAIAVAASAVPGFIIWAVHHLRRQRARQAGPPPDPPPDLPPG